MTTRHSNLRRHRAGKSEATVALFDVGNTNTHIGLANQHRVLRRMEIPTEGWQSGKAQKAAASFIQSRMLEGLVVCSVVPAVTPRLVRLATDLLGLPWLELNSKTVRGIGLDYPRPESIGADRLANAVAVKKHFGSPAVVVDFGTAVTLDVVDGRGNYVGGIIAPGLSAMTEYLHQKTALLPKIELRPVTAVIGKNTEEAMRIGAVHGYRGLVKELVQQLQRALHCRRLPVVATGGYGELIAAHLPIITAYEPLLTLEGLRLVWQAHQAERVPK